MRIMDKKVVHKRFGMGSIIGLKDNKIYVSFGKIFGDKIFPYPEVFAGDMKMMDEDLQEELMEDIGRSILTGGRRGNRQTGIADGCLFFIRTKIRCTERISRNPVCAYSACGILWETYRILF